MYLYNISCLYYKLLTKTCKFCQEYFLSSLHVISDTFSGSSGNSLSSHVKNRL